MKKSLNYNRVNWVHYLSRPMDYFQIFVHVKDYKGKELKKISGIGYDYWLLSSDDGRTIDYYYRREDVEVNDRRTQKLIENRQKTKSLFKSTRKVSEDFKKYINLYKQNKVFLGGVDQIKRHYQEAICRFIEYFVYAAEIPYITGSFLEKNDLHKAKKYQWLIKECEYFRGDSLYPEYQKYVLGKLLRRVAGLSSVKKEDFLLNTSEEVLKFLKGELMSRNLSENARQRRRGFVCFAAFGKEKFIRDRKFVKSLQNSVTGLPDEIKGRSAQKGQVTGKVKIVLSEKEFVKFKKGNILITIQSNPSFMPILRKASAVIADEGGIMSHAAIISRELGIPCIIGTKIATKVLKDGDLVEVDADKGVVKILKIK